MITTGILSQSISHCKPIFNKTKVSKVITKPKHMLYAALIGLGTLGLASCNMQNNGINGNNHEYRSVFHDPCCSDTNTQFKMINISPTIDKFNLMLNNLGLIDEKKDNWFNIDKITIASEEGDLYSIENRGIPLADGGHLNLAVSKKGYDGVSHDFVGHFINGYGGIKVSVEETNIPDIALIPAGYAYIWQGDHEDYNGDNTFVLVDTSSDKIWYNVYVFEKKGDTIVITDKNGKKSHLLLDTVQITNKSE